MMKIVYVALGLCVMGASLNALVVNQKAAQALAQQRACFACHAIDKKVVGPSFKDVANRYRGNVAAEQMLIKKIKKGGGGVWGNITMPRNNVTDAEAKVLAQWVLSQ